MYSHYANRAVIRAVIYRISEAGVIIAMVVFSGRVSQANDLRRLNRPAG